MSATTAHVAEFDEYMLIQYETEHVRGTVLCRAEDLDLVLEGWQSAEQLEAASFVVTAGTEMEEVDAMVEEHQPVFSEHVTGGEK